ncbi:hypothetical protein PSQ19_12935 [Devosia algicola]|uniref:Uncharacterized protein n=1 Tax=Devosia algicola TaxID=3026418 RepID=A0ABY7YKE2_9HYPH|nr:hypothetical protein [Devosia algicola]WDR01652.1 hypothetical protein PSQ19_12935 [Devosia algicola]
MNVARHLRTGTVLGLLLGLAAVSPGFAQSDTTETTAPTPDAINAIDFGDNTSAWANDTECDDPRFIGSAMAVELEDVDIGKDAADCKAAFEAGTVTLRDASEVPPATTEPAIQTPEVISNQEINYGDDLGQYPNDGDCDDPRFEGSGAIESAEEIDTMHDASDCRAAVEAGTAILKASAVPPPPFVQPTIDEVNFGDDEGTYPNDNECDDARFEGAGVSDDPSFGNIMHDASDCRAAFAAGSITVRDTTPISGFAMGTDNSKYANDGQCDDPRFEGSGVAKKLLSVDQMADATDCAALMSEGTVWPRPVYQASYQGKAPYDAKASGIDFGDNTSSYANDDECDDPRFEGPGVASDLTYDNQWHDANDCRAAFEGGTVAAMP